MGFRKLFLPLFLLLSSAAVAGGYQIKITIKGVKDTVSYLAHHYMGQQQLIDTARFVSGTLVFDGKKELPGGIYVITLPRKKYFEILVDKEQTFSLASDTADMVKNMKFTGSPTNKQFYDYLLFISKRQAQASALRKRLVMASGNKDSTEILNKKISAVDKEVKAYKQDFIGKNPGSLMSSLFRAMTDPEIPKTPLLPNGRPDSLFPFRYMQAHYFDNIDFNDGRLTRTPVMYMRLVQYFENFVYHHPDSINKAADALAERARGNKDMFKYVVHYVTSTYETSKIMGMDAVFVHMAEKYYVTHQAYWVDTIQLTKIVTRALKLKPTLIESPAPEIVMNDSTGKPVSLLGLKAKYTAIFFWNYDCQHCQESAEKLLTIYHKYKPKGFEVYAVETETAFDEWKKYIAKHKLDWVNVCDKEMQSNFRAWYDIYMTPLILLIDEKKKIVAKQVTPAQVDEILARRLK